MQFIDLKAQQQLIKDQLDERIQLVMQHGRYIMGPEVAELESKLADITGAPHALGCGSGTDALLLCLMALGVGPGDAILCPTFTFIATAEVVSLLGATPVFLDVREEDFNLDPAGLEAALEALAKNDPNIHPLPAGAGGLRPKAVLAVDLFGLPADYAALGAMADKAGLTMVEDAAQSLGSSRQGVKAGALAPLAATSFFPAKPLGCYGDGGMVFCQDAEALEVMRSIRVHGQGSNKYDNVRIGLNARLDTLQAAILLAKLELFEREIELRQEVAGRYAELLSGREGLRAPQAAPGCVSAWAQYSLLAKDEAARQACQSALQEAGVPSAVYYPKPLHRQEAFAALGYREGDFPVSEDLCSRVFSIPMHPYLQAGDQEKIVEALPA